MIRGSFLLALSLLVPLSAEAPRVRYCELALQSRAYDNELVRTQAEVLIEADSAFLYDLDCNGRDAYAELALVCPIQEGCANLFERVRAPEGAPTEGRVRASLFVLGRLQDWNGMGYGIDRSRRVRFEVTRVDAVFAVAAERPWPDESEQAPAPFLQAMEGLREVDARLCAALAAGDVKGIAALTTGEYVFTRPGEDFTDKAHFLDRFLALCGGEAGSSCSIERTDISAGLGAVAGRIRCASGTELAYSQTYSPSGTQWRAARGQLQTDLAAGAGELLRQLSVSFDTDHEFRPRDFEEFPAAYHAALLEQRQQLEAQGFQYLLTREDLTLARVDPHQVNLMSLFLGPDGSLTAEMGVVGGHPVVSLATEFPDGRIVGTSNAQLEAFVHPMSFDVRTLPFGTQLDQLLQLHAQRVGSERYADTRPVRLAASEVEQAYQRRYRVFREHRLSVGYLTKSEMEGMMGKQQRELLLEQLWLEFHRLAEAHRKTQQPEPGK